MTFTVKDWKDLPDTSTPLSAAAIEDLETRLAAYTDSVAGAGGGGAPSVTVAGNLGASRSDTMVAGTPKWISGTLNANHTATITQTSGGLVRYLLTQDATGGRSFTISDGTTPTVVNIAPAPSSTSIVDVYSDGTDLYMVAI